MKKKQKKTKISQRISSISKHVAALALVERLRQIEVEGHTPELDIIYNSFGQLGLGAAVYAMPPDERTFYSSGEPTHWPSNWNKENYKPTERKKEIIKAIALLMAEYERLHTIETNKEFASDRENTERVSDQPRVQKGSGRGKKATASTSKRKNTANKRQSKST